MPKNVAAHHPHATLQHHNVLRSPRLARQATFTRHKSCKTCRRVDLHLGALRVYAQKRHPSTARSRPRGPHQGRLEQGIRLQVPPSLITRSIRPGTLLRAARARRSGLVTHAEPATLLRRLIRRTLRMRVERRSKPSERSNIDEERVLNTQQINSQGGIV
jgi:hypothetical protein